MFIFWWKFRASATEPHYKNKYDVTDTARNQSLPRLNTNNSDIRKRGRVNAN